ncbi:MAG: alpha/beta hydrolase-fold protein [Capsulimonas sp.]|uniref:alpha/beta hydrolase n=1 Tax=Capsulimonas sp. TaxID=2494211 RepID=UPI0032678A77
MNIWRNLKPPQRRRLQWIAIPAAIVVLGVGLWRLDWVRQNVQIQWLAVTGRAWRVRGQVHTVSILSPALGEHRSAIVYTPPGYDAPENETRRYPVLYLLHGAPGGPDDWLTYGRAPEVEERLIEQRKISPTIIVCPDGDGDGYMGDSEYIDAPVSRSGRGPGKQVGTFIVRDLPSWIDAHYRTIASPKARILGGVSTGGYGAVNLALTHPGVFNTVFSFSGYYTATQSGWARPVWGYHPSAARLSAQSPQDYVTGPRADWSGMWIYLGDGRNERGSYAAEGDAFAARLQSAGIACDHVETPGSHSWDLWRPQLRDALIRASGRLDGFGNGAST